MKLQNFYKEIISGTTHILLAPPATYVADGRVLGNFNQNPAWMTQYGWREWTDAELAAWHAQYDPPAPETVYRFSKLKIMEYLGEKWAEKKEELVAAGVWEYWENATFLATDYPLFKTFFARLSEQEKAALINSCQWE